MSLRCDLMINGEFVGSVGAHRVSGTGMGPDDGNTYFAAVALRGGHWTGEVEHRFGDGAWGLVRRAIEAMEVES